MYLSLRRSRRGALMIDALIGLAVFSIIVSGVVYGMLLSQQSILKSGDRIRGALLNQKAIGAIRAIRDDDFENLIPGTHGIRIGSSGFWELSGTGTTTEDGYTTSVTIEALAEDRIAVSVLTSWVSGIAGGGETELATEFTDWRREEEIGNWASISLEGSFTDDGTPLFNKIATNSTHAFVTSEVSDGGNGLYVFDITDLDSPERIVDTFDLGVAGYDLLIVGDTLFVVTGDSGQEVRLYDITDSTTFGSEDLIGSINVPGSGLARTLIYFDNTLFVGSNENGTEAEFFAYDVADPSDITLLDSLDDTGASYAALKLQDGYAYLASSADTMELRVIDVFDPTDLQFAPGGGYNVTDITDALSLVTFGNYVLVGRFQGDITEELHLFDVSESPVPPAAPFNAEAGAAVNGLDAEPTATYAFAATGHDTQEFIVLNVATFAAGGNPIVETYDTDTGAGRGVYYDAARDRTFLLTNSALLILRPS